MSSEVLLSNIIPFAGSGLVGYAIGFALKRLRQARVAANNIISVINRRGAADAKKTFDYKTKGMMVLIGQRNGVGILFGHRVHGFTAWWLWRSYYLGNLPTLEKKLRVAVDWFIDLFFKRDVTRLKTLTVERSIKDRPKQTEVIS
ncbi:MAG TPA: hypothetical protein VEH06_10060 [Candidatus Bathyarchaeia archaeon]|nr:hypothetical protein [Candidatus Bathyarchaeia archaeon]